MEFGMFHQFPVVPGGSQGDAFARGFEQVDVAERYGLDAMWLAELHVDPARSVLAAGTSGPPLVAPAARSAADTGRVPARRCRHRWGRRRLAQRSELRRWIPAPRSD